MTYQHPTSEAFDAMNDAEFDAYWAAHIEAVRAVMVDEHEFMQACVDRNVARNIRDGIDPITGQPV